MKVNVQVNPWSSAVVEVRPKHWVARWRLFGAKHEQEFPSKRAAEQALMFTMADKGSANISPVYPTQAEVNERYFKRRGIKPFDWADWTRDADGNLVERAEGDRNG